MAKSKETYNKKEKEKKRLKQQQDKKTRSAERKAQKRDGNSLDDMIAYIDENGNLTDTPPDPSKKQVYLAEDIEIGVPRREESGPEPLSTGTVIFFNDQKGFGFISRQPGNDRIFFHIKDLLAPVSEGDLVSFISAHGPRGLCAEQVNKA